MNKRIHHMGMTLSKDEHGRFHKQETDLSPKQHQALRKRLGVTQEQDEEWHRTHLTLAEQRARGLKQIDAAAAGSAFLAWCVKQGWVIQRGKQHLATRDGARELLERFEIRV